MCFMGNLCKVGNNVRNTGPGTLTHQLFYIRKYEYKHMVAVKRHSHLCTFLLRQKYFFFLN